jgi:hypothetical protein
MSGTIPARTVTIGGVMVLSIGAFFWLVAPIPQDPAYYLFADSRTVFGVPNFFDVASNAGFLLVGVAGLAATAHLAPESAGLRFEYAVFFAGVLLTAVGSAWFHLHPGNDSLVWDRLPMTIAFAGLVAIVVGSYLAPGLARAALYGCLLFGVSSVFYWAWTEARGSGDLRPYALAQFLPLLFIPVVILLRRRSSALTPYLWALAACYVAAKILEHYDAAIFARWPLSGHTLKHLAAALGTFFVALAIYNQHIGKESA